MEIDSAAEDLPRYNEKSDIDQRKPEKTLLKSLKIKIR